MSRKISYGAITRLASALLVVVFVACQSRDLLTAPTRRPPPLVTADEIANDDGGSYCEYDDGCDYEDDYGWDNTDEGWDAYFDNGDDGWNYDDGDVYSDGFDDYASCSVGSNCTLYEPSEDDWGTIMMEIVRLEDMDDKPYCQAVGTSLSDWVQGAGGEGIKFYNNYIPASDPYDPGSTGYLGGDIHAPNNPNDPYAGEIHIYKDGRSTSQWLQTLRHEGAHAAGSPDAVPANTSNPYLMNAEQVATYCS